MPRFRLHHLPRRCFFAWLFLAAATALAAAQPAIDRAFTVTRIELAYTDPHPLHPDLDAIAAAAAAELVEIDRVLYAPAAVPTPREPLDRRDAVRTADDIGRRFAERLDPSAIGALSRAVVRAFEEAGVGGVRVGPDPRQVGPTGDDIRPGPGPLRLLVRTGRITDARTIAAGDRFDEGAENLAAHRRFLDRAPVRPPPDPSPDHDHDPDEDQASDAARLDLLRPPALDRHLARINRHPGRYARALVRPDPQPGGDLGLDLVISEAKPWLAFAQISNTGTEATGELRYRLGLIHNQLTGNDDILSLSYVTSAFDGGPDFQAFTGSYESPVARSQRFRYRLFGSWSEFSAAELGQAEDAFVGDTAVLGADLIANVAQFGELFIDLEAGVRFESIEINNNPSFIFGSEDLLIATAAITFEKRTLVDELVASVGFEASDAQLTGGTEFGLTQIGRFDPSLAWVLMTWDVGYSFYLEPVLNRRAWRDPTTPASSTLAHEIAVALRGQFAFDHRIVPQQQGVVGGLFSVRGYAEAITAGDGVLVGSLEYRFHLPRTFGIEPDPQATPVFGRPFRIAPQQVYGAPDWDFVLKGFVDIARVWVSDPLFFEFEPTLLGVGFGAELAIRNNLSARVDWGFRLRDVMTSGRPGGDAGGNEVHFAITISY